MASAVLFASACSSGPPIRDEVVEMLGQLAKGYQSQDAAAIVAHYSADFAVADPMHRNFAEAVHSTDGLRITRTSGQGSREDLREILNRDLSEYAEVIKAKFVLDDLQEVKLENGEDAYEVRSWFNLYGLQRDGSKAHEESSHRLLLVRRDDGGDSSHLEVVGHEVLSREIVAGDGNQFVSCADEVGLGEFVHSTHAEIPADVPIVPGNFSGSGAAAGDVDDDGWLDLLVGDGERTRLYRNRGDGTFEDITDRAFGTDPIGGVRGAYLVDLDDDGRLDVLLTRAKQPLVLLHNQGELQFVDHSDQLAGVRTGHFESAAFGDLDRDGDLDAYVLRYGDWEETSWAYPLYEAKDGVPNALIRNDGDGRFVELDDEVASAAGWGLAVSFGDYDADGDQDIYVVNDFGSNKLLRNDGGMHFADVTADAGIADQGFGMSSTFGDYDGDGDLDVYVANMHSSARWVFEEGFPLPWVAKTFLEGFVKGQMRTMTRGNSLFRNRGDGTFEQIAAETNVERNGWAWGADFLDYDNDGDLDIYCPNGFITGKDPADC